MADDFRKHHIFVQRLKGTQTEVITAQLEKLKKTAFAETMMGTQGKALNDILRDSMAPLTDVAIQSSTDIAEYESSFTAKLMSKHLDVGIQPVDAASLEKSLRTTNMSINARDKGADAPKKSLKTAYDQYARRKADEVAQVIKDAQIADKPLHEIRDSISSLIDGLHTAQAKSLARTTINFVAALARTETIQENKVVDNSWIWDATLENSCGECEQNDGQVFDEGDEEPPIHWGCNCSVIPSGNMNE